MYQMENGDNVLSAGWLGGLWPWTSGTDTADGDGLYARVGSGRFPHVASRVLMVRPTCYYSNEETIADNKFMVRTKDSKEESTERAQTEFDEMVDNLTSNGITVT